MAGTLRNPNPDRTSNYIGVTWVRNASKSKDSAVGWWRAQVTRNGRRIINKLYSHDDERGAAKAVDIALLKSNYSPVNDTLKRIV